MKIMVKGKPYRPKFLHILDCDSTTAICGFKPRIFDPLPASIKKLPHCPKCVNIEIERCAALTKRSKCLSDVNDSLLTDLASKRMNFSDALTLLKQGHRVARIGWNGKGMWLNLQRPDVNSKMTHPYVFIEYPAGHAAYPNGSRVPWLASQTDLMADDWDVLPDDPAPDHPAAVTDGQVSYGSAEFDFHIKEHSRLAKAWRTTVPTKKAKRR